MSLDYRIQFWGLVTGGPLIVAISLGLAAHNHRNRKVHR
jgi:hypothetical protein